MIGLPAPGAIGTSNQKREPPAAGKSAPTVPRSASISCFTMERPSPVLFSPPVGWLESRAYSPKRAVRSAAKLGAENRTAAVTLGLEKISAAG